MAMAKSSSLPKKCGLIWPFFLILTLHLAGIYFFTLGFLLTRTELSAFSHCSDFPLSPCSLPPQSDPNRCWTPPAVERLVIIVLDALRFDFVAPSTFFEEKMPWMDKLRVLQKLASGDGSSSARIFKAIADPPTTSLQRLKGLTTGGLPTFVDVGNSFGAPAIVEDNLIYQLAKNGKRILMMGDDTWIQLFPDHFNESYPYPSFNVKDLDTVDNGCIEHLLPSLYKEDWDVLIAHFLGVDHAGHIFGIDSDPMVRKLEQYNGILEEVVNVLKIQSGPGGLHENTLLVVMGDHGQTLNGDHGGGTSEEVETSLFVMSLRSPPPSISSILDESFCKLDLEGKKMCISSMHQLDFAASIAALLGIPFPFGSVGRVNPELYALSAGTWDGERISAEGCISHSNLEAWMQNYANVLCVNSWQVKRYIDLYNATSFFGLHTNELIRVSELYTQAQSKWSNLKNATCLKNEGPSETQDSSASIIQQQIDAYLIFLENVAGLARSSWTEFNLAWMAVGLVILVVCLFIQVFFLKRINILLQAYSPVGGILSNSFRLVSSLLLVAIRAVSFLSNSYILAEGRVANFLLATTGLLNIWFSISTGQPKIEEFVFLGLNIVLRVGIEFGVSKQPLGATTSNAHSSSSGGIFEGHPILIALSDALPILLLSVLVFLLFLYVVQKLSWRHLKYFSLLGTILSYMLIVVHWISESSLMDIPMDVEYFGRIFAPRLVFAVGFLLLVCLVLSLSFYPKQRASNLLETTATAAVAILSAWSSTILILLGRQGALVALICIIGAWCIIRSQEMVQEATSKTFGGLITDPIAVTQWSFLAVCLFFYTGHWCTFDGLRYGAAFIGFDEFNIIRQGVLLVIDTFGVSHVLPILSLPFLVTVHHQYSKNSLAKDTFFLKLSQVLLSYGLISTLTSLLTIICVTIQRRHLMVWGLFAPKYVFDVLGLIITDVLICLASLYYY